MTNIMIIYVFFMINNMINTIINIMTNKMTSIMNIKLLV